MSDDRSHREKTTRTLRCVNNFHLLAQIEHRIQLACPGIVFLLSFCQPLNFTKPIFPSLLMMWRLLFGYNMPNCNHKNHNTKPTLICIRKWYVYLTFSPDTWCLSFSLVYEVFISHAQEYVLRWFLWNSQWMAQYVYPCRKMTKSSH